MLEKSLPYIEFLMKRPANLPLATPRPLAKGYRLVYYQPGDKEAWCEIETAVGEFDQLAAAQAYFQKTFAPHPQALTQRMAFVEDQQGQKIATCTAWWGKNEEPLLHWLAVKPEAQHQGIAGFLAATITQRLLELYPEAAIFLHTQTWSYPAIFLYEKLGYELLPRTKDFDKGVTLLKTLRKK